MRKWKSLIGCDVKMKLRGYLRVIAGILLIAISIPPLTLYICNFFVLLPAAAGIVLLLLPMLLKAARTFLKRTYGVVMKLIAIILIVTAILFAAEFGVLFAGSFATKAPDDGTVIVLGAKVEGKTPTIDLMGRISTAAEYLKAHPEVICIASGGKGPDEDITEAECIKSVLINQFGIDHNRIYTEDTSKNTLQNLQNSLKIIEQKGLSKNAVIVTDGYHTFRSRLIAKRVGLNAYAYPAATDWRLTVYMYLRELLALPKSLLFDK